MSDANQLALGVRIGLGAADVDQEAGRLTEDVLEIGCGDLGGRGEFNLDRGRDPFGIDGCPGDPGARQREFLKSDE